MKMPEYRYPTSKVTCRATIGAHFDYVIDPPNGRESLDTLLTVGLSFDR